MLSSFGGVRVPSRALNVAPRHARVAVSAAKAEPSYVVAPGTKYAVIDIGGAQQVVEEGRWYTCNRLQAEVGSTIKFGRVLAVKTEDGKLHVGKPWIENVEIHAEIVQELKDDKVIVYHMKPKKHTRKKVGFRQSLTKFMVTKIVA